MKKNQTDDIPLGSLCISFTKTAPEKIRNISDKEFHKRCRDAAADCLADGMELDDVAMDLASNMLYDREVEKYVKKHFGREVNRMLMVAFVADYIAE